MRWSLGLLGLALGCTPDSEMVGQIDTETGSSTAMDTEDASASEATSLTAGESGTSAGASTEGDPTGATETDTSGTGDLETTGGELVDACVEPTDEDLWNDDDACPFALPAPCDQVVFSEDINGDLTLDTPAAAQCALDQLGNGDAEATFSLRHTNDTNYEYLADVWLFADATAVVDLDGFEDKSHLGRLPRAYDRPDPAQFAGCSVDDPADALFACLAWWQDAACVGTPVECDQALP